MIDWLGQGVHLPLYGLLLILLLPAGWLARKAKAKVSERLERLGRL